MIKIIFVGTFGYFNIYTNSPTL